MSDRNAAGGSSSGNNPDGSRPGSSNGDAPHRRGASALDDAEQEALDRLDEAEANAQSWGAPSNALHGLLRKLGAGLDDLLPSISASHSKLKTILTGLKAEDDGRQLAALSELCELLSIGAPPQTLLLREMHARRHIPQGLSVRSHPTSLSCHVRLLP